MYYVKLLLNSTHSPMHLHLLSSRRTKTSVSVFTSQVSAFALKCIDFMHKILSLRKKKSYD